MPARPRFHVLTVTGYRIGPRGASGHARRSTSPPGVTVAVLDRAFANRTVWSVESESMRRVTGRGGMLKGEDRRAEALRRGRARAVALNAAAEHVLLD